MAPERHVELAPAVEAAQPVVPGAVEVIEQLGRLAGLAPPPGHETVEVVPMLIVELALVAHRNPDGETALQMLVEVDGVRVHVVEQCPAGVEAERDRETAAERLDQSPARVPAPQHPETRHEPALATGPLQGRLQRRPALVRIVSVREWSCFGVGNPDRMETRRAFRGWTMHGRLRRQIYV